MPFLNGNKYSQSEMFQQNIYAMLIQSTFLPSYHFIILTQMIDSFISVSDFKILVETKFLFCVGGWCAEHPQCSHYKEKLLSSSSRLFNHVCLSILQNSNKSTIHKTRCDFCFYFVQLYVYQPRAELFNKFNGCVIIFIYSHGVHALHSIEIFVY